MEVSMTAKRRTSREAGKNRIEMIEDLLGQLDPDLGYYEWSRIGMAVYHETGGSGEGMAIYDSWSSRGTKYKGINDIRRMWRSFRLDVPRPVTIGTLIMMARESGCSQSVSGWH
jgi:hypothetical protein